MSTRYGSREEAFQQGFRYAARYDLERLDIENLIKSGDVVLDTDVILRDVAGVLEDQIILKFKNCNGLEARMGSAKFRDGYDLWLIAGNGIAHRI